MSSVHFYINFEVDQINTIYIYIYIKSGYNNYDVGHIAIILCIVNKYSMIVIVTPYCSAKEVSEAVFYGSEKTGLKTQIRKFRTSGRIFLKIIAFYGSRNRFSNLVFF